MQYKEKFTGSKEESAVQLKEIFKNILNGTLEVEGEVVKIPYDKEIEYKVKYENDPEVQGSIGIKIGWSFVEELEEEEGDEFTL